MFKFLFLLLFPLVSFAVTTTTTIVQNPDQVALLVNTWYSGDGVKANGTAGSDGIPDRDNIVAWYKQFYPTWDSTNRVIRMRIPCLTSDANGQGGAAWKYFHPDIDSAYYASGHVDTTTNSYALRAITRYFDTHSLWGKVKYLVSTQGMPLKLYQTGMTGFPANASVFPYTSGARRSFDDAVTCYLEQGKGERGGWHMTVDRGDFTANEGYIHDAIAASPLAWSRFTDSLVCYKQKEHDSSGTNGDFRYWNVGGTSHTTYYTDSTFVRVLVTRLESFWPEDIYTQLSKSADVRNTWKWNGSAMAFKDNDDNSYNAIIDNCGDSIVFCGNVEAKKRLFYPWYSTQVRTEAISLFGYSKILHDSAYGYAGGGQLWPIDSSLGFFGCNTISDLTGNIMLYHSAGYYNGNNGNADVTGTICKVNFPQYPRDLTAIVADNIDDCGQAFAVGSWLWLPESNSAWSVLADTSDEDTYNTLHGFISRYIHPSPNYGDCWTFATGTCWEPLTSGVGGIKEYIEALSQPNVNFATMAYASEITNCWQAVHLGDPIAQWYDSKNIPATISCTFIGSCNEAASGTFTCPADTTIKNLIGTYYAHAGGSGPVAATAVTTGQAVTFTKRNRWGMTSTDGALDSIVFKLTYNDSSYVSYKITP